MLIVVNKEDSQRKILDDYMLFYEKNSFELNTVLPSMTDNIPLDVEILTQALQDNYEHPVYPVEYCHMYMLEKIFSKFESIKDKDKPELSNHLNAVKRVLEKRQKITSIFSAMLRKSTFIFCGRKSMIVIFKLAGSDVFFVYPVLFYNLVTDEKKLQEESENLDGFTGKIVFDVGGDEYKYLSFRTYDNSFGARTAANSFENKSLGVQNQSIEDAVITGASSDNKSYKLRDIVNSIAKNTGEEDFMSQKFPFFDEIGGENSFINFSSDKVAIAYFVI